MSRRLPKPEARQQLLETAILGIYCYAIAVASAFIGPALFHTRNYNVRGFAILLGLIFGTPAFIIFWWRKSRREKRVEYHRKNGICVNCGYDLRGNTTGICPECGKPVECFQGARTKS